MLLDISRCFLSIRKLKYQFTAFGLRGRAFSFSPTNECCTLSKAFEKSIAKSWHSYNPYHQVPLNSYTVFELRRPRNYSHPYTQIECPSDFPKRLSYGSDDSSFKTARYDWSYVNPANGVTVWNWHMAFTNSFVHHAHKYSHYAL